ARLLINRVPSDNAWVGLRLVGSQSPRSADGARVAITDKAGVTRWRRVHSDGSYLSASDHALLVGLGDAQSAVDVGVVWPSGLRELWRDLAHDTKHELLEGSGMPWVTP
ncbi:MAG: ASPIC/UnbV domain-containing protein, partial [Gammaproteobacteria bacterium]